MYINGVLTKTNILKELTYHGKETFNMKVMKKITSIFLVAFLLSAFLSLVCGAQNLSAQAEDDIVRFIRWESDSLDATGFEVVLHPRYVKSADSIPVGGNYDFHALSEDDCIDQLKHTLLHCVDLRVLNRNDHSVPGIDQVRIVKLRVCCNQLRQPDFVPHGDFPQRVAFLHSICLRGKCSHRTNEQNHTKAKGSFQSHTPLRFSLLESRRFILSNSCNSHFPADYGNDKHKSSQKGMDTMTNKPAVALITGSYGGLGAAFAAEHARRGGTLILSDLNKDRLETQRSELEKSYGVKVFALPADLSKREQTEQLFDDCHAQGLSVDYLILNAGFGGQGTLAERPMEKDMAMIAVNVESTTRLLKLFLPEMLQRSSGKILLISSISAKIPGPRQAVYFASKAYLTSLGNAVWRELRGTGVTLTTVMPGILATDFAEKGQLEDTLLFSRRADPVKAAKKAYKAMLQGRMNAYPGIQLPMRVALPLAPFLPKSLITDLIYALQKKGTSAVHGYT